MKNKKKNLTKVKMNSKMKMKSQI